MKLVLIRHAEAEDRAAGSASAKDDALRPLTEDGRKRMRKAAAGLKRVEPAIDVIGTSPLVRAVETAALVGKTYGVSPVEVSALAPGGKPAALLRWIAGHNQDVIALVGHEPDLGQFASWLLTRSPKSFIEFKKGGVVLLEFPDKIAEGKARLRWALTPGQLRKLKK